MYAVPPFWMWRTSAALISSARLARIFAEHTGSSQIFEHRTTPET